LESWKKKAQTADVPARARGVWRPPPPAHTHARPPPPPLPSHPTATPDAAKTPSVASVAAATPSLSTLTAAVTKAGLADWLSNSTNTLTVFAPSDDAFAAYLAKAGITSQALLDSPDLKSILKYHIVKGAAVQSSQLKDGQVVETKLGGAPLTIDLSSTPGSVIVKGAESSAKVISADVPAGNSVVHVIDAVLVPSSSQIAEAKAKWEAKKKEREAAGKPVGSGQ
jgi:uncharacterized surface protein with fasciclin (FAS1) repeats